jgi:hypothetical protein
MDALGNTPGPVHKNYLEVTGLSNFELWVDLGSGIGSCGLFEESFL